MAAASRYTWPLLAIRYLARVGCLVKSCCRERLYLDARRRLRLLYRFFAAGRLALCRVEVFLMTRVSKSMLGGTLAEPVKRRPKAPRRTPRRQKQRMLDLGETSSAPSETRKGPGRPKKSPQRNNRRVGRKPMKFSGLDLLHAQTVLSTSSAGEAAFLDAAVGAVHGSVHRAILYLKQHSRSSM